MSRATSRFGRVAVTLENHLRLETSGPLKAQLVLLRLPEDWNAPTVTNNKSNIVSCCTLEKREGPGSFQARRKCKQRPGIRKTIGKGCVSGARDSHSLKRRPPNNESASLEWKK